MGRAPRAVRRVPPPFRKAVRRARPARRRRPRGTRNPGRARLEPERARHRHRRPVRARPGPETQATTALDPHTPRRALDRQRGGGRAGRRMDRAAVVSAEPRRRARHPARRAEQCELQPERPGGRVRPIQLGTPAAVAGRIRAQHLGRSRGRTARAAVPSTEAVRAEMDSDTRTNTRTPRQDSLGSARLRRLGCAVACRSARFGRTLTALIALACVALAAQGTAPKLSGQDVEVLLEQLRAGGPDASSALDRLATWFVAVDRDIERGSPIDDDTTRSYAYTAIDFIGLVQRPFGVRPTFEALEIAARITRLHKL